MHWSWENFAKMHFGNKNWKAVAQSFRKYHTSRGLYQSRDLTLYGLSGKETKYLWKGRNSLLLSLGFWWVAESYQLQVSGNEQKYFSCAFSFRKWNPEIREYPQLLCFIERALRKVDFSDPLVPKFSDRWGLSCFPRKQYLVPVLLNQ